MAAEPDSDEPIDDPQDLVDHVVATSESADPEETMAAILGGRQDPASVTDAFVENEVTLGTDDSLGRDEETRHELRFDDRVAYLPGVADALIAAELVDRDPVTVRSLDPASGEPVTFEVADDGLDVTPDGAVINLGMAADVPDSETMTGLAVTACGGEDLPGGREPGASPTRVCEYINAFETVASYEQWATDVDAESVAVPPEPLMAGTRQFVASQVFDQSERTDETRFRSARWRCSVTVDLSRSRWLATSSAVASRGTSK